jgi:MinD-like ATPase involved in chromosome partitioning or flagellar assembly
MLTNIKLITISFLLSGCIVIHNGTSSKAVVESTNSKPEVVDVIKRSKCNIDKIDIEEVPLIPFVELEKLKDSHSNQKNVILAQHISDLRKYISKLKAQVFDLQISVQKCL